jgi:hypothetical protein
MNSSYTIEDKDGQLMVTIKDGKNEKIEPLNESKKELDQRLIKENVMKYLMKERQKIDFELNSNKIDSKYIKFLALMFGGFFTAIGIAFFSYGLITIIFTTFIFSGIFAAIATGMSYYKKQINRNRNKIDLLDKAIENEMTRQIEKDTNPKAIDTNTMVPVKIHRKGLIREAKDSYIAVLNQAKEQLIAASDNKEKIELELTQANDGILLDSKVKKKL